MTAVLLRQPTGFHFHPLGDINLTKCQPFRFYIFQYYSYIALSLAAIGNDCRDNLFRS